MNETLGHDAPQAHGIIARARKLGGTPPDGNCAYTGEASPVHAAFAALGDAKHLLTELADTAAEDARRLDDIRALLAAFDWEHDDRQYALEAVERIANGGRA